MDTMMRICILPVLFLVSLFFPHELFAQDNAITCEEALKIMGSKDCPMFIADEWKIWCGETREDLEIPTGQYEGDLLFDVKPPTYTITHPNDESSFQSCISGEEDGQEKPSESFAEEFPQEPTKVSTDNRLLIQLPISISGWLHFLANIGKARLAVDLIKSGEILNLAGGVDHSACDPATCEQAEKILHKEKTAVLKSNFNQALDEIEDGKAWPFLQRVEIRSDDKPIRIKAPHGTFELRPVHGQKGILEYKDKTPILKSGQLEVLEKNQGTEPTTIETPNAELFVIGTHFLLRYDQKEGYTIVAVNDGTVEVRPKGSSSSHVVSPEGDTPGVVLVMSKFSIAKTAVLGIVVGAVFSGVVLSLKRKFS